MKKLLSIGSLTILAVLTLSHISGADVKSDPEAYKLFKEALERRYSAQVSKLTAKVTIYDNDNQPVKGELWYEAGKGANLRADGLSQESTWPGIVAANILRHLAPPRSFETEGEGRYPITFGPDKHSPAGRHIQVHNSDQSSYWIQDGRFTRVERTQGEHFIIDVIQEREVENGIKLPWMFTVSYSDSETKALKRTETFKDEYQKIKGVWVPQSRSIVVAEADKTMRRKIVFDDFDIQFNQ
jgi:uncharacterized protein DUF3386